MQIERRTEHLGFEQFKLNTFARIFLNEVIRKILEWSVNRTEQGSMRCHHYFLTINANT